MIWKYEIKQFAEVKLTGQVLKRLAIKALTATKVSITKLVTCNNKNDNNIVRVQVKITIYHTIVQTTKITNSEKKWKDINMGLGSKFFVTYCYNT